MAKGLRERLDVADAAEYLGLSASALNKYRSAGKGPRYLRIGNRVFYRMADLDAYVEKGVVETTDSRAA